LAGVSYNQLTETLSFIFPDQVNWTKNTYAYQYFTEPGTTGYSDLFVIQGLAGTTTDYVTFISDPGFIPNPPNVTFSVSNITGTTPQEISAPVLETGGWQLAYNTGVDQFYIQSDVPEPDTLSLLALGVGLLGFRRRKVARYRGLI
jgi:hypothetical protein